MTTAHVTAVMLDGTKHEAVGVYMALADRVAFERRYISTLAQIRKQAKAAGEDGEPDWSVLKEEEAAFFSYRILRRAEVPCGEFDEFLEAVEEVRIETLDGPADPTDPSLPPGT